MAFFSEDNFYPANSPGYIARLIHQMSVARFDELFADDELTATQWMALVSIHFGMGDTCAGLARSMAHDKGAMTRLIDTIEARGWVNRARNTGDRRLVNLSLTREGQAVAMRARDKVIDCWNDWLTDWDDDEVAALVAQLQKLHRTIAAKEAARA